MSPMSTAAATAVEPLFGDTASAHDLNSMAAMLMAAATGQMVDDLHMQEFNYDEEEAKATAEIVPVANAAPSARPQSHREEMPRIGTPVSLDIRREIAGPRRRDRTAKQLAQAVVANVQKLTSHAMHLSRELKVQFCCGLICASCIRFMIILNHLPPPQ